MNIGRLQVSYPPVEMEPIKSDAPDYWKACQAFIRVRPPLLFKRNERSL